MALLDRVKQQHSAHVETSADTDRHIQEQTHQYSATERKNIKVDPPVFDKIQTLRNMRNMKTYEFIAMAVDSFAEEHLSEREKAFYKMATDTEKR